MLVRLAARLRDDVHGATAIEYGLLVGLIAMVAISSIAATGSPLGTVLDLANDALVAAG